MALAIVPAGLNRVAYERTNEVIIAWAESRLREVCRVTNLFLDYLLIYRKGYKSYSRPRLSAAIVQYVVEEIFNCAKIVDYKPREVYPEDFKKNVQQKLLESSSYELEVAPEVVEYLWKYISHGVATLTEGLDYKKTLERVRNAKKRALSVVSREQIRERKSYLDRDGDDLARQKAVAIVASYRGTKWKLNTEIEVIVNNMTLFKEKGFRSDSLGFVFTDEIEEALLEFGVKSRHIKGLKKMAKLFHKLFKESEDWDRYRSDCIELLKEQMSVVEKMLKSMKHSAIGNFLEMRKVKNFGRTGLREQLDRIYEASEKITGKWIRPSITRIFIDDADYNIHKVVVTKPEYESTEKWIFGDEETSKKELKLTAEMIDAEYIDFSTKKAWRSFLDLSYKQLEEKFDEIDNDEDLKTLVSQQIVGIITSRIDSYQVYVSQRQCTELLDNETDNCILQSLVYLSVTLSDWLELETIGGEEIRTALKILLPERLVSGVEDGAIDNKFLSAYVQALQKVGLRLSNGALKSVAKIMTKVKSLPVDDKGSVAFHNRVRYFSNSLLPKAVV